MKGMKIMCMCVFEYLESLNSISILQFALRKLTEAFGLKVAKSCYPHYFNTRANLDYVGKIPDISYYCVVDMTASKDRVPRLVECQKVEFFDNRRVLESYCQDDVSVLR